MQNRGENTIWYQENYITIMIAVVTGFALLFGVLSLASLSRVKKWKEANPQLQAQPQKPLQLGQTRVYAPFCMDDCLLCSKAPHPRYGALVATVQGKRIKYIFYCACCWAAIGFAYYASFTQSVLSVPLERELFWSCCAIMGLASVYCILRATAVLYLYHEGLVLKNLLFKKQGAYTDLVHIQCGLQQVQVGRRRYGGAIMRRVWQCHLAFQSNTRIAMDSRHYKRLWETMDGFESSLVWEN